MNYNLTAAAVWQFARTNTLTRSVKSFTIQTSADALDNVPPGLKGFALGGATNVRQIEVRIDSARSRPRQ